MNELKDYYKAQAASQPVPTLQIAPTYVKARSRHTLKIGLIAAMLTLLTSVTALAYGSNIIERITVIFGNSVAVQSDVIDNDPRVSLQYTLRGQCERYLMAFYGFTVFYSLDEVRNAVPFAFREPINIPNFPEYLEFNHAVVLHNEEGEYFYRVSFNFTEYGVPFNFAAPEDNTVWPEWHLFFSQKRVGPNASLQVRSVGEIDRVMIGEVEALGISLDGNLLELMFIHDGTFYHLSGRLKPGDLLAIAESLVV